MKTLLQISAMSALLGTLAVAAGAQTTVFSTDNGVDKLGTARNMGTYSLNFDQGVGFTSNIGVNPYYGQVNQLGGVSAATALAAYDAFTFTGATTAGPVNIAVHGNAFQDPAGNGTVVVYANIYTNAGTSAAPLVGTNVLRDVAINFTSNVNDRSDFLYTSTLPGLLAGALTNNSNYIISFNPRSTAGTTVANTAVVDQVQNAPFAPFAFTSSDSDSTGPYPTGFTSLAPIGFRIISAVPVVAPEPSSVVSMMLGALVLGGLLARRRRRAA